MPHALLISHSGYQANVLPLSRHHKSPIEESWWVIGSSGGLAIDRHFRQTELLAVLIKSGSLARRSVFPVELKLVRLDFWHSEIIGARDDFIKEGLYIWLNSLTAACYCRIIIRKQRHVVGVHANDINEIMGGCRKFSKLLKRKRGILWLDR